jgi:DNA-binding LacI/PurR family transcriptional regulator/biotin operon repressor
MERNSPDEISSVLECALSRPPSAVGLRLLPEENLADVFNVSRWQIRKSIDSLVQRGFLVRRKGSGTYVRMVPDIDKQREKVLSLIPVPTKDLFSASSKYHASRYEPTQEQKRLYLELWTDLTWSNRSHQFIMANIVDGVNQANHRITIHSAAEGRNQYISVDKLRNTLRDSVCDGYIVIDWFAERFLEALGPKRVPYVFFGGSQIVTRQPIVMIDNYEAIRRSINIFHREGFSRIGMIGIIYQNDLVRIYEQEMRSLNLEPKWGVVTDLGIGDMMQSITKMLSSPSIPEALYIADENLLECVKEMMLSKNIIPGKDIAIITQSTRGNNLPPGYDWSCMEIDLQVYGHMIIDNLLNMIQRADAKSVNHALLANWIPGKTHCKILQK